MPDETSVLLELERLRGTCSEGFARLEGAMAVLVERSDRTEDDLRALTVRVSALERRVWTIAGGAMVLGAGGSVGVTQLL